MGAKVMIFSISVFLLVIVNVWNNNQLDLFSLLWAMINHVFSGYTVLVSCFYNVLFERIVGLIPEKKPQCRNSFTFAFPIK